MIVKSAAARVRTFQKGVNWTNGTQHRECGIFSLGLEVFEIHGKNITFKFKIDATSHRKDNPNSINNTYISSTRCVIRAESVMNERCRAERERLAFKACLPV